MCNVTETTLHQLFLFITKTDNGLEENKGIDMADFEYYTIYHFKGKLCFGVFAQVQCKTGNVPKQS